MEDSRISDVNLWHARLGHLHMDAVVNLSKRRASGMKSLSGNTSACNVCHRGKLTAKPFVSRTEKRTKLLEIVHSDLCEPSKIRSEGGNQYFVHGAKYTRMIRYSAPTVRVVVQLFTFA